MKIVQNNYNQNYIPEAINVCTLLVCRWLIGSQWSVGLKKEHKPFIS